MEEDEVENLYQDRESHMTESDKIKLRLRKFCYVIGVLFILWIISIIIVFAVNKPQDNDPWSKAYESARKFISNLNSTEIDGFLNGINNINTIKSLIINKTKINNLCEGQIAKYNNSNIDFKGMCIQEGTTGVQFSNGTGILWQSEINTAATFNETLIYEIGKAQGNESKEKGINTLLSPSVNIMRTPQHGILLESFGEDPFYSGVCASEIIKGIQDSGVIATIKHFLGNDQNNYKILDLSNIKKNALMDIYVEPFYRAIHDAEVGAVMAGNNTINKIDYNENKTLLTHILRDILNFRGFVISDLWDIYKNFNNNCSLLDLNIQKEYTQNDSILKNDSCWASIKNKNESATRIIASMYKMNQLKDYPEVDLYYFNETRNEERKTLQREAAIESQVLLKNNDNILPLKKNNTKIAVIGNIAMEGDNLFVEKLNFTELSVNKDIHLRCDSTKFGCFKSPLQEIKQTAPKIKNITVISSGKLVYNYTKNTRKNRLEPVKNFEVSVKNFESNKNPDVYIVFVIATSVKENAILEKIGGKLYLFPRANDLIRTIVNNTNKDVIVVIHSSFAISLPWFKEVKAVLFSGFPGEEGSQAIADILFGNANPSGHLPFVWAELDQYKKNSSLSNSSTVIDDKKTAKAQNDRIRYDRVDSDGLKDDKINQIKIKYDYPDGLYIGQRWFNKYNKTYIFPFGFGLSYSSFQYGNFTLSMTEKGLTAKFTILNNSTYPGQAVPMMFLSFPDNIIDYPKFLFKGFKKVKIKANEKENVTIFADEHALSYFNVSQEKYVRVTEGIIKVYIAENGNITEIPFIGEINANYKI